ncbi:hypothetical protein ACFQBQ_14880 [Granulicella cerasi]|uniref:Uncharacterized protein n=1 Tax=Granulicella cerasi TaxID=741063 RepID=A0ABW1ZDP1_9BACT|nr:hypothetical protein [Granulicella cerasi]
MQIATALWAIALAAFTVAMVYRAHLTQHEVDELFLSDEDGSNLHHQEQEEIVRRVNWIHPFCRGAGAATAALTLLIVGVTVARALPYVHFH